MKKSFSAASIIAIALTLAVGYDSDARKEDFNKPAIENVILIAPAQVVVIQDYSFEVSPYVIAETLSPSLASNFNRLVVFPELGSSGEESGFAAVIRGPPKIFS